MEAVLVLVLDACNLKVQIGRHGYRIPSVLVRNESWLGRTAGEVRRFAVQNDCLTAALDWCCSGLPASSASSSWAASGYFSRTQS